MRSPLLTGGCHCGVLGVRAWFPAPPAAMPVRACQCRFCRRHGARTVTDRAGRVEIILADPGLVQRYRFGTRQADYLICGRCGAYAAAVIAAETAPRCTLNVNLLDAGAAFDAAPPPIDYTGEDAESRWRRRLRRWTPAIILEARSRPLH